MSVGIDFHDAKNGALLSSLQGNILKGHGRDHTTNIFVQFRKGMEKKSKEWIAGYAQSGITSMLEQLLATERFKETDQTGAGDTFSCLYLSAEGYRYLNIDVKKFDKEFTGGMKGANARLHDIEIKNWETGFREDIHMMVLLADDDRIRMSATEKNILNQLLAIADIRTIEYGHAIRDANGVGLEHNGYADGISQPLFLKGDIDDFKKNNPGIVHYDPSAEPDLVLVADPHGHSPEDRGSYFVFRKLEQNVRGFKHDEETVLVEQLTHAAKKAGLHFGLEDGDRAGAMVVGRYEDGSPITVSKFNNFPNASNFNNFNYDEDSEGAKCPYHAHIRKANPRGKGDKEHVMARRAIPYGQRDVPTESDPSQAQSPTGGVGLLFQSYQKSFANQFEFIQIKWLNDPNFPKKGTGSDPLIGEDPAGHPAGFKSTGKFGIEYGNTDKKNFTEQTFDSFIKLKGGEYFFAPSISFLINL